MKKPAKMSPETRAALRRAHAAHRKEIATLRAPLEAAAAFEKKEWAHALANLVIVAKSLTAAQIHGLNMMAMKLIPVGAQ